MSTAEEDLQLCLIDAVEQAVGALLDVIVMRKAGGAETALDSALRAAIRELGVVLFELGGPEAMTAVAREASVDAPPNSALRVACLNRAWRSIGERRGGWSQ